jgi:thiol-disulfide isomerase/thioredoxin
VSNTLKRVAVIGVGVLVVAAVAFFAFRPGSHDATSNTSPTAFDLPALTGGGRVRLTAYRGTPVVLTLFASWCTECRVELPAFARAAADLRGKVQFVGVDSLETGDGRAMAGQYHLAESGFALGKDVNNSALHQALKAPGMPITVFYNAQGQPISRDIASVSEATFRAQLHRFYGV